MHGVSAVTKATQSFAPVMDLDEHTCPRTLIHEVVADIDDKATEIVLLVH